MTKRRFFLCGAGLILVGLLVVLLVPPAQHAILRLFDRERAPAAIAATGEQLKEYEELTKESITAYTEAAKKLSSIKATDDVFSMMQTWTEANDHITKIRDKFAAAPRLSESSTSEITQRYEAETKAAQTRLSVEQERVNKIATERAAPFVTADDFIVQITKVDGNNITYQRYNKGEMAGDPVTIEVASDAKFAEGNFDAKTKKFVAGDAIEGGLNKYFLKNAPLDNGVMAQITTSYDNKKVTQILVHRSKKKASQ